MPRDAPYELTPELTPRSKDWMPRQCLLDKARHDPEHFRPAYDEWREHSLRLNDQWRLVVEIQSGTPKNTVTVVSIEDYH